MGHAPGRQLPCDHRRLFALAPVFGLEAALDEAGCFIRTQRSRLPRQDHRAQRPCAHLPVVVSLGLGQPGAQICGTPELGVDRDRALSDQGVAMRQQAPYGAADLDSDPRQGLRQILALGVREQVCTPAQRAQGEPAGAGVKVREDPQDDVPVL